MLMKQVHCMLGKAKQQAQATLFSNQGFNLMELLMASVILVIVLVGSLSLFIQCIFLNEINRNYILATKSLQTKMEEAKEAGFFNIHTGAPLTDPCPNPRPPGVTCICNGDTFNIDGFQANTARGRVEITDIHPNLKQVRVIGSFRSRGRTVGGDVNFNGVVDGGENPGSPAELVTLISLP